ncbi:MAG: MurR/RpiR family transcriptional regulator [Deltaproteobacteria bacterium]|nr:MurR/RpiR family transcriptional regulator [Deltaproteobacteria bacterium]MBT7710590.1 MurR/RpiR family transcriptional regulator [Deltaproteobacteria bacterium]
MAIKSISSDNNSVMEVLLRNFERLTPTERKPARILLDNYPMEGLVTIAQFAKKAKVSGPTVLRLVAKLGFARYPEFQNKLRQELQARLETPVQKTPKQAKKSVRSHDFIAEFSDTVCQNIKKSFKNIPVSEINSVTQSLGNTQQAVYLIGGRYTFVMAEHFYLHLHAIRPNVSHIDRQSSTWADHLLDIKKNDLVIVFDIRRYQDDIVSFAGKALKMGAKIILFTDQWLSPIASIAHHVFTLQTKAPSNWDSSTAIMTLIDLILAKLTKDLWLEVKDRLDAREENFQSF